MPIDIQEPIVVPEKTFSEWIMTAFYVTKDEPDGPHRASAEFRPYRVDSNGIGEFGPGLRTHSIGNVQERIAADPVASGLYTGIMMYIVNDARNSGII